MKTPQYISSCAITQKIGPANVCGEHITVHSLFPKSSWEVFHFESDHMHIHKHMEKRLK